MKTYIFMIFLLINVKIGLCAKILAIFSIPSYSHYVLGSTVMKEMNKRGHEVTFVSFFKEKDPLKNWTDIILTNPDKHGLGKIFLLAKIGLIIFMILEVMNKMHFDQKISSLSNYFGMFNYNFFLAEITFRDKKFKPVLNSSFDLVVYDKFSTNLFTALGYYFKCPVVPISTLSSNIFINNILGNPHYTSYSPNPYYRLPPFMNLWERFLNCFFDFIYTVFTHLYSIPLENKLLQEVIGPLPHLKDLLYNVDLFLLNSHHSLNPVIPLVPSMKEIGGAHVKPPKNLPLDIEKFIESNKEGVVYISLGSVLDSNFLRDEQKEAFIKCFANITQSVLWKFDGSPGSISKNVKTIKWVTQTDVIAHKNIKVFISHCGKMSIIESIYYGVPLLCIPVFGDQFVNAKYASLKKYAVILELKDLTANNLKDSLNKIFHDTSYKENAKLYSNLFHDRPRSPMDEAIYWLEYVLRHKGMPYTKCKSLDLNWYEKIYLEPLTIILLILGFLAIRKLK
ncbi:unnamed protein product [Brassicogethes aeneus]|uniref:UDP-glucuronosyltransferase n=1 Tax=Brassicogethes aeneus TaxID=1431903 RepID=A0A9P0FC44_BRAAE|nr:unnamed protein product [Brassicogethes aeneus]